MSAIGAVLGELFRGSNFTGRDFSAMQGILVQVTAAITKDKARIIKNKLRQMVHFLKIIIVVDMFLFRVMRFQMGFRTPKKRLH